MDKKVLVGFVVVLVLISLIMIFNGNRAGEEVELQISEICFEEDCFIVEIADDNEERAKGLMFREELCSDCGMLFVYDEERNYKYWMKNTLIPLDIIWLDSDLEVVYVANAVPCVTEECELYGPDVEKGRYVLEVNGGIADGIGLLEGSELELVYG